MLLSIHQLSGVNENLVQVLTPGNICHTRWKYDLVYNLTFI